MPTHLYADLLASNVDPEIFLRRGLRLLEKDFRELALLALGDWETLDLVAPELFPVIASLQRPSWGLWNGLLTALRQAKQRVLRTGKVEERDRVESAATLNRVLAGLNETAPVEAAQAIKDLAKLLGATVGGKVKLVHVHTLPITLRNALEHGKAPEPAGDPDWWRRAADGLRPLLALHAEGTVGPARLDTPAYRAPWFLTQDDGPVSFNGLTENAAVIYATPAGGTVLDPARSGDVLLAFQRLLGRSEEQAQEFRQLLARLAPEEQRGVLLGDYLLGKPVGKGGFATVHVGRQLSTGRRVAIKVLNDGMSEDDRERFKREAEYLSHFDHPHIVRVLGHGEDAWSAPRQFSLANEPWFAEFERSRRKTFIVLEWIEGQTLDEVFRLPPEAAPPLATLTEWFAQAAETLEVVHAAGMVHRDVKPSNLMVDAGGQVHLMDFGIARTREEVRTFMTATGGVLGTPAYMAPEQIMARPGTENSIGPAADIYALCGTFYELYTRRRLFDHDTESADTVRDIKRQGTLPRRLRTHRPDLPWELEVLLLGGLQTEITDRPRSMGQLHDDLRRVQRDEPITYHRPSLFRRLQLGYRRNRTLTNVTAGFVIIIVGGILSFLLAMQAEQHRRALARVDALFKAHPQAVSSLLTDLKADQSIVLPRLLEHWDDPDLAPRHRRRVALALLSVGRDPGADLEGELLIEEDPAELVLLCEALRADDAGRRERFWAVAGNKERPVRERCRALIALAAWEPESSRWPVHSAIVVEELLAANPLHLGLWTEALQPVRKPLLTPLSEAYRNHASLERRQVAARVLSVYAADDPAVLAGLIVTGDARQAEVLWPALLRTPTAAVASFRAELTKKPPENADEAARDALARRQAYAAAALLRLGEADVVWPLLRHSPDPRLRSYLIHALAPRGVAPQPLAERLGQETEVSARRALLLALGTYPASTAAPAALLDRVTALYRDDPDAGIHGAADWLLRTWNSGVRPKSLADVDAALAGKGANGRRWYVTPQKRTMVILTGPFTYQMGTPDTELDRRLNEKYHRREVPYSFAVATHEVMVKDFEEFLRATKATQQFGYEKKYAPQPDCPMISVTWNEAVRYCNWLSEREGLPPSEWCYLPPPDGSVAPEPVPDFAQRSGYRLLTEAEWEYACRAGAVTSRYYGNDRELLGHYAWYQETAKDHAWPVGLLKPNDFGLFDMHGGVWEWCHERFSAYPSDDKKRKVDPEDRGMRGGSFTTRAADVRSGFRFYLEPGGGRNTGGFRVARTLASGTK